MDNRSVKDQVVSGLWLSASAVIGFLTIALLWAGIAIITGAERVPLNSPLFRILGKGVPPIFAGWIFLTVSSVILILTMDRWVKVLPGFFAYSTLGGLIMLFGGRYNGVPVPWYVGLFLTLFGIATTAVSLTFQKRKLHMVDRTALMGFQICLALGATKKLSQMFTAVTAAFLFLLLAWAADRIQNRRLNRLSGGPTKGFRTTEVR